MLCAWGGDQICLCRGGGIALYSGPYDTSLRDNWVIFQLIIIYHLEIDNRLAAIIFV